MECTLKPRRKVDYCVIHHLSIPWPAAIATLFCKKCDFRYSTGLHKLAGRSALITSGISDCFFGTEPDHEINFSLALLTRSHSKSPTSQTTKVRVTTQKEKIKYNQHSKTFKISKLESANLRSIILKLTRTLTGMSLYHNFSESCELFAHFKTHNLQPFFSIEILSKNGS